MMANTWYASTPDGQRVTEFRSIDYDPDALVEQHGPVMIVDMTDGHRFVDSIRPEWHGYGEARYATAVRG